VTFARRGGGGSSDRCKFPPQRRQLTPIESVISRVIAALE